MMKYRSSASNNQNTDRNLPENLIPVSCNRDCGGGCPLVAEMAAGKPVRILDNPLRPDKEMHGCARGYRALDAALSPDRLTTPLKRTGERGSGQFIPLSWDDVLDEIAEKLMQLKTEQGPEAMMVLAGSGSCRGAVHTTSGLTKRFFSLWGKTTTTRGYYSNAAAMYAAQSVFGHDRPGQDPDTLRGAELVILWGANICDTRFGAKMEPVLRDLKRSGVPFYVIDPRLTRTGKIFGDGDPETMAHEDSRWLALRPGTDAALMAAILYLLIEEDRVDRSFLDQYSSGFDQLESWVTGKTDALPKTPEWAAGICGLAPEQIRTLARAFGKASPAALIPGLSIQRVVGGEDNYRMAMALQVARGNIGISGGTSGGCLWDTLPSPKVGTLRDVRDADKFPFLTVPVNNWQDGVIEGTSGGYPSDIRAIYSVGNNYVLQSSDQEKTRAAFCQVDFSVCHDLFLTGTARWCDYILPATHFLERNDILSAAENYLYYSKKVLDPPGEARDDYDIFLELSRRVGLEERFSLGRTSGEWIEDCLAESEVPDPDLFKTVGYYDSGQHDRIAFSDFIKNPSLHPLNTPDGLINFSCPGNIKCGLPAYPHFRGEGAENTPSGLQLITPHGRYRTNSQHSNLPWFKAREYPLLHMNPKDAEERSIREGMDVLVKNEQGSVTLPVSLSPEVRGGTVWALQGDWEAGASINRLSSTKSTMPSHGSRTHSIIVEVSPISPEETASD
ncbi:MAG: molybdopterin-dependent oxidoreductase [Spirochaetales bacterium]|nr:molybdopterin-dependent oxidoreductase [Spirochaetales bacterium]